LVIAGRRIDVPLDGIARKCRCHEGAHENEQNEPKLDDIAVTI
jgi:hypothetical protein